ncbi:hypothetical protein [Streptomyces sp. I6]|nr:hypothetical protein [Streptomyces sp. I6]
MTKKPYDRTEGHGREEARVVQVLTVDDLDFPTPHRSPGAYAAAPA